MWFKLLAGHLSLDAYLVLGLGTRSTSQMEFIINYYYYYYLHFKGELTASWVCR